MILERADGGWFTTEAPDRTYKTQRGAKQAERMFQNPQLWQGWQRQTEPEEPQTPQEPEEPDLPDNEEEEVEDVFIGWYELPNAIRQMIHDEPSTYRCIEELLSNGWTGVHLSSIIEDFGESVAMMYLPQYFM